MMYISRILSEGRLGVVGTDDNYERVLGFNHLERLVLSGVVVHGVTVDWFLHRISHIEVWRLPEHYNREKMRMKALYDIDIHTRGQVIEQLGNSWTKWPQKLCLRLSDFGSACRQHILRQVSSPFVCVLDDYITISPRSLCNFQGIGVTLDMREVSRQDTLDIILGEIDLLGYKAGCIIDRPERMKLYMR